MSPSTILTTFASKVVEFPQDATGNTTIMMGKSNFVKKNIISPEFVEYRHVSTSLFTGSILTSHYFMGGLKTNLFAT
uniref:Uncharacterized protein n=3 Tax=Enterobacteriaceae TaxID=543 RepID=A0A7M1HXG8_ECOLX|nr:hypothetical protein [Escherichia coli]